MAAETADAFEQQFPGFLVAGGRRGGRFFAQFAGGEEICCNRFDFHRIAQEDATCSSSMSGSVRFSKPNKRGILVLGRKLHGFAIQLRAQVLLVFSPMRRRSGPMRPTQAMSLSPDRPM